MKVEKTRIITFSEVIMEHLIESAKQGNVVKILGVGQSMSPLLTDRRDYIYLTYVNKEQKLSKGDIVLYRTNGIYVIHRICKCEGESFCVLGDGNVVIEKNITRDMIYLKAVAFEINGVYRKADAVFMWIYGQIWIVLRPIRPIIIKILKLNRIRRKVQ